MARLYSQDEFLFAHYPPFHIFLIRHPSGYHVFGHPSTEYVSEETPMVPYANVHIAFEQMRVQTLRAIHGSPNSDDDATAYPEPPRVLVVGPENSGKTTLCKILANCAIRTGQDWSPLLINVDPSEVFVFFSLFLLILTEKKTGFVPRRDLGWFPGVYLL
jgi:N-terminal beta-sandwich domain of polyadenylation factor